MLRERDELYTRQDRAREIENEQSWEKFHRIDQDTLNTFQGDTECARKLKNAASSTPRVISVDFSHSKSNPIRYSTASYRGGDDFRYFILNGNENFIYSFRELKTLILINLRCIEPTTNLSINTIERVELRIREPTKEEIEMRIKERTTARHSGLRRMSLG